MALFGGDMADVVTPDGRRITVPSQLAQAFPGLQPFVPPEVAQPPELPSVPAFAPQPSDALPPPRPEPPSPAAPSPAPVPQPQPQPQQPVVKPVTNAELAKMGPAGAANVELEAQNAQRAAVERQGEALANQATAVGEEMERANEHADKLLLARQQYAEQRAADLQSATDALTREAKSISDVRVDRSVDHPVLAALSAALIGVGQAMNKQPIDAMGAVYKAIDRKVAAQMADLDQRRANYAMSKDALGMQRQAGRDRLDEMDAHRLAYLDQARRQLEEIKQKTSSDVIRSNTAVLQAELDRESAKTVGVAQDRYEQRQRHKEALAEQRAARAQSAAQFQQSFAENKRTGDRAFDEQVRQFNVREQNDLQAAEMAARAKGNESKAKSIADAQKAVRENGIRDVARGTYMLEPEGDKMVAEAQKLEAEAAKAKTVLEKEKDPNKQQALVARISATEQRAAELRGEALANHAVQGRNPAESAKVQQTVSETQSALTTIDQIKELRAGAGPQWTVTTDADQAMRVKVTLLGLQIKEAYKLGALDKGTDAYMRRVAPDPTKITVGDFELAAGFLDASKGTDAAMDALADSLENRARNELGSVMKEPERYKFQRSSTVKPSPEAKETVRALKDKTSTEATAADAFGALGAIADAGSGGQFSRDLEAKRAASGSPGLLKGQEAGIDKQIQKYRAGVNSDNEGATKESAAAADLLVRQATDTKRPELRNAMLAKLKDAAPDLYQRAVSKLSTEEQTQISQGAAAVGSLQPVALLQKLSIDGDAAARAELARRAVAGDAEAAKAIQQVIKSRTSWRPTGAVR